MIFSELFTSTLHVSSSFLKFVFDISITQGFYNSCTPINFSTNEFIDYQPIEIYTYIRICILLEYPEFSKYKWIISSMFSLDFFILLRGYIILARSMQRNFGDFANPIKCMHIFWIRMDRGIELALSVRCCVHLLQDKLVSH